MARWPVTLPEASLVNGFDASGGMTVASTPDTFHVSHKAKNINAGANQAELWYTASGVTDSGLVLLQSRPEDTVKWYAYIPAHIGTSGNPNSQNVKTYCEQFLIAENNGDVTVLQPEVANTDDSYSLRDIVDFRTSVAAVSINGTHDWIDENTLKLFTNTIFQFNPKEGWAATLSVDGESQTVIKGENLTVVGRSTGDNLITLETLQFVAQDGTFDIYSGDFKTATVDGKPIAYYGAFVQGERTIIEEFSNTVGSVQLIQNPYDAITDNQGEYLVFRTFGAQDIRRIGMVDTSVTQDDGSNPFVPFTGLDEAKEFYDSIVAVLVSSEADLVLKQEMADEEARRGTIIGSETLAKGKYSTDPGASVTYNIRYSKDGKYSITNEDQGGNLIALYPADDDVQALALATPKIKAYHNSADSTYNPPKPKWAGSGGSWWIIGLSVVGLVGVVGLIVWLRMRKDE